ncbi:TPA: hypothetical protein EYG84_01760 [Candidatus Gracilibacteria bacterium]|nr:hypothetical protein [Candidatus Gracilibacteria bacterium]
MALEKNDRIEGTPTIPVVPIDTTDLLKEITTNEKTNVRNSVENNLTKLQKTTPDINISKVIETIAPLAILVGADEKNITNITKIIKKDSGISKFISDIWSKMKPYIPSWIISLFKETDHGIGDDTSTTIPSDTTIEVKKTPKVTKKLEVTKSPLSTITKAVKAKLDMKTKSSIVRMFEGSTSPPMKEKFILPSNTTYKNLQAELKLKSSETVHGGDTEKSPTHKGTYILMKLLENKFPNMFKYSAAVNDDFHHDKISYHSKHQEGVAFDYTLNEGKQNFHLSAYPQIKEFFQDLGINTSGFINEYARLSKHGTAGHIHMSFAKKDLDQVYKAYTSSNAK